MAAIVAVDMNGLGVVMGVTHQFIMGLTLTTCWGCVKAVTLHGCSEAAVLLNSCGVLVTHLSYLIEALHISYGLMLSLIMLIEAAKSRYSAPTLAISIAS